MFVYGHLGQVQDPAVAAVRTQLPSCYSQEFDDCITEVDAASRENRPIRETAYCAPYTAVIRDTTRDVWDQAIDLVPHCPAPVAASPAAPKKKTTSVGTVVAGVGGLLLGAMIGASL